MGYEIIKYILRKKNSCDLLQSSLTIKKNISKFWKLVLMGNCKDTLYKVEIQFL